MRDECTLGDMPTCLGGKTHSHGAPPPASTAARNLRRWQVRCCARDHATRISNEPRAAGCCAAPTRRNIRWLPQACLSARPRKGQDRPEGNLPGVRVPPSRNLPVRNCALPSPNDQSSSWLITKLTTRSLAHGSKSSSALSSATDLPSIKIKAKQRHQVLREQTRLRAPIRSLQSKPGDLSSR
jgi:hypothetical protein